MPASEEAALSFVRSSIKSAWTLELLLVLYRDPQRRWTLESLVRELRGSAGLVAQSLASLRDAGLVLQTDVEEYSYRPESQELDAVVSALVELYAQKPITVLKAIFTSPSDRIQSFSDAFLIRRGDKK